MVLGPPPVTPQPILLPTAVVKLHMVAASDRDGVIFSLSAGNCGDGPEGRALLRQLGPADHPVYLLIDPAYEGDETRALAVELGCIPVVPPKSSRKDPWDYDKELYKLRNQVERLFRRIQAARQKNLCKSRQAMVKKREANQKSAGLGTVRLNRAYPPVFRDGGWYARAA